MHRYSLRDVNKRDNSSGFVVALVLAAAAAIAAYRKRPVKPPAVNGTWQPVESQRTRRQ